MQRSRKTGRFSRLCYAIILWLIKVFYPKISLSGEENIPEEGCILVGNHTKMNGPICGELYVPGKRSIWCAWQMMQLKEVPAYAYSDFWSSKPAWCRWFYKLLSYVIAPLSICVFNNAHTIAVYHDNRLLSTFKQTVARLQEGARVVIFPECYEPHNHIVNNFQDRFTDVAKLYYKRSSKAVAFVPMYVAPELKKLCFGKPIYYSPDRPMEEQREEICRYLMAAITDLALAQPRHLVVPYANLPKKKYVYNIPEQETIS